MTYGHGPTWLTQRDTWLTTARAELERDHGYQRPPVANVCALHGPHLETSCVPCVQGAPPIEAD